MVPPCIKSSFLRAKAEKIARSNSYTAIAFLRCIKRRAPPLCAIKEGRSIWKLSPTELWQQILSCGSQRSAAMRRVAPEDHRHQKSEQHAGQADNGPNRLRSDG